MEFDLRLVHFRSQVHLMDDLNILLPEPGSGNNWIHRIACIGDSSTERVTNIPVGPPIPLASKQRTKILSWDLGLPTARNPPPAQPEIRSLARNPECFHPGHFRKTQFGPEPEKTKLPPKRKVLELSENCFPEARPFRFWPARGPRFCHRFARTFPEG